MRRYLDETSGEDYSLEEAARTTLRDIVIKTFEHEAKVKGLTTSEGKPALWEHLTVPQRERVAAMAMTSWSRQVVGKGVPRLIRRRVFEIIRAAG